MSARPATSSNDSGGAKTVRLALLASFRRPKDAEKSDTSVDISGKRGKSKAVLEPELDKEEALSQLSKPSDKATVCMVSRFFFADKDVCELFDVSDTAEIHKAGKSKRTQIMTHMRKVFVTASEPERPKVIKKASKPEREAQKKAQEDWIESMKHSWEMPGNTAEMVFPSKEHRIGAEEAWANSPGTRFAKAYMKAAWDKAVLVSYHLSRFLYYTGHELKSNVAHLMCGLLDHLAKGTPLTEIPPSILTGLGIPLLEAAKNDSESDDDDHLRPAPPAAPKKRAPKRQKRPRASASNDCASSSSDKDEDEESGPESDASNKQPGHKPKKKQKEGHVSDEVADAEEEEKKKEEEEKKKEEEEEEKNKEAAVAEAKKKKREEERKKKEEQERKKKEEEGGSKRPIRGEGGRR